MAINDKRHKFIVSKLFSVQSYHLFFRSTFIESNYGKLNEKHKLIIDMNSSINKS
jgi:hypothetical protein